MNYISQNLTSEETIKFATRLHWINFVRLINLFTLFIPAIIKFRSNEFAVTNKRVIVKHGWISRRTTELSIAKVESLNVRQGVLGRILNYGTLHFVGSGGNVGTFKRVAKPGQMKKAYADVAFA